MSLDNFNFKPSLDVAQSCRIGIVSAGYNRELVENLMDAVMQTLLQHGVSEQNIENYVIAHSFYRGAATYSSNCPGSFKSGASGYFAIAVNQELLLSWRHGRGVARGPKHIIPTSQRSEGSRPDPGQHSTTQNKILYSSRQLSKISGFIPEFFS